MECARESCSDQIQELEHLLYGWNYQISLFFYGPLPLELSLEEALALKISPSPLIDEVTPSSAFDARGEIVSSILWEADEAAGPADLSTKCLKVNTLIEEIFSTMGWDRAVSVGRFTFKEGHPAYPVWWDFSYELRNESNLWILIGSASD